MNIFPAILETFANTRFRTVDTGSEKPRLEGGRLIVTPGLLAKAAEEGFGELSFFLRESHLSLLARALCPRLSPGEENSANDNLVIRALLKNAVVSSRGELALCQDTGTAVVYGWKDEGVYSGADDAEALEAGAAAAYRNNFLRSSQTAASSFFGEFHPDGNIPAQVKIDAVPAPEKGSPAYRFLFIAKGGGSSNKTSLFSMTKALLEKNAFDAFLAEKIPALGTAACPPYRLAVVVGGTSPEFNLEVLKLAAAEALDRVPYFTEGESAEDSRRRGWIRRDKYWEDRAMEIGRQSGLGAQFGGKNLLLDARVLRLPRHAASCPVSVGVSCAAHRNILAVIDREGLRMEQLVRDPAAFLRTEFEKKGVEIFPPKQPDAPSGGNAAGVSCGINLDRPVKEICRELSGLSAGAGLLLSGKLLVARDAAHLKWRALLAEGKNLPAYIYKHPIYYAGPSATPPGKIIGSIGPTTAGRMDTYAEEFMSRGASLITLAKGNRSEIWKKACARYGGFYLGTLGGAAALLAEENVTESEVIDYPDLGMEAVRLITVRNLPAFILIDNKGNTLY